MAHVSGWQTNQNSASMATQPWGASTAMRKTYRLLAVSVAFASAIAVFMVAHRHYRRWHAGKYIEYRGEYLIRKQPAIRKPGVPASVPWATVAEMKSPSLDPDMQEGVISMLNSFLAAYSSTDQEDYITFRFQETSQPWTTEIDPKKLKLQLPMWPELLGASNVPAPPLSRFGELIANIRQYHEDDGTMVFCVPCVTEWRAGSLSLLSFKTNTIDKGFAELHDRASLISKNQGAASKPTFLAYPQKVEYPTLILSFVVDTLRSKGKDIIVLQAIWLAADKRWIAVGIGVAPHSGYISYPF